MTTVTISLPEDDRLEAPLVEGLDTGGGDIPLTRQFWSDLKVEAIHLASKHQTLKRSP